MHRKKTPPGKRETVRQARRALTPAMSEAMRAASLAHQYGLMVLACHAIDNAPYIAVAARPDATQHAGRIQAAGITIE